MDLNETLSRNYILKSLCIKVVFSLQVQLWMPIIFVTVSAILLVVPVVSEPVAVIAGALMTLAGVPVYYLLVRSKPKCVAEVSSEYLTFL